MGSLSPLHWHHTDLSLPVLSRCPSVPRVCAPLGRGTLVQAGDWTEWRSTASGGEVFVHVVSGGLDVEVGDGADGPSASLGPGHVFLVPKDNRFRWRVSEPSIALAVTNKVVV